MNELILPLDTTSRLIIQSPVPINDLALLQRVQIVFQDGTAEYVLYVQEIVEALDTLCPCIQRVLTGNHILAPRIANKDIGYLHNKSTWLSFIRYMERVRRLHPFLVLSALGDDFPYLETWLYNDKAGNIILHITEFCRHEVGVSRKDYKIVHDQFMKNYKPLVVRTVPREVAKEWLFQLERLLKITEDNNPRYVKENGITLYTFNPADIGKKSREKIKKASKGKIEPSW